MTPKDQVKEAGLSSLKELSEITKIPVRTLSNWHKNNNERFTAQVNLVADNKQMARIIARSK